MPVTSDRLDPIGRFWLARFGEEITPLERHQFEWVAEFCSLNDPFSFIIAYAIRATYGSTKQSINDLLLAGSSAKDLAHDLTDGFVGFANILARMRALKETVERDLHTGEVAIISVSESLQRLKSERRLLRQVIYVAMGVAATTCFIAAFAGVLAARLVIN